MEQTRLCTAVVARQLNDGIESERPTHKHRRHRSKALPEKEWARLRPIITRLYIEDEMPLKELQVTMATQHGLNATVQMYKKRFSDWRVWKNYRKEQYESYGNHTTAPQDNAQAHSPVMINSKPVKQHKVRRYQSMQKRRQERLQTSVSPSHTRLTMPSTCSIVESAGSINDATGDQSASLETCSRQTPASSGNPFHRGVLQLETLTIGRCEAETFLHMAWDYYRSLLTTLCPIRDHFPSKEGRLLCKVFGKLAKGVLLQYGDSSAAWPIFNHACSHIEAMLQQEPFHLVFLVLYNFSSPYWPVYRDVRLSLLRFITGMANKCLGSSHAVTGMLLLLLGEKVPNTLLRIFPGFLGDMGAIWLKGMAITYSKTHFLTGAWREDP